MKPHQESTIFERIGGRETVLRVVDAFYNRVEQDPELRPLFPNFLHHGRQMQRLFLEEWLGGEPIYSQRGAAKGALQSGMQSVHWRFAIPQRAAGRWLHHMGSALQECGVSQEIVAEIMAALGPMAHSMINDGEDFPAVQEALKLAAKGDLPALRERIERTLPLVRQRGTAGRSLLWESTRRGHQEVVAFLIEKGADVDAPGGAPVMLTPYALARSRGHDDLADYLLAQGAEMDIFTAAYLGDMKRLVQLLDDDPALVNAPQPPDDVNPITPLYYAVNGGQLDAAKLLIDRGAEVEAHAATLLSWASSQGRADIGELLKAHDEEESA